MENLPIKKGDWQVGNPIFTDLEVAHHWQVPPTQYFAYPYDDKLMMAAYTEARSIMSAWESQEQEKQIDKERRQKTQQKNARGRRRK